MRASSRSETLRQFGAWIFGVILLSAVIVAVVCVGDVEHFTELARHAHPLWLAAALLLQALTYVCAAAVWYVVLDRAGKSTPLRALIPLGLAKLFTDQAIPSSGVSGSILVVQSLLRQDIPSAICAATLLVGLISYYAAYGAAVAISIAVLGLYRAISPAIIMVVAVFSVVAVGVPALTISLRHWIAGGMRRRLEKVPGLAVLLRAVADAPTDLLRDPVLLGETIALQFLVFALDAATLYVMLRALGSPPPPGAVFASFVMANAVATIGPVPLGLGVFEGACVTSLNLLGIRLEAALAATLLLRGFTFWLPMLPGLWIVRRELRST